MTDLAIINGVKEHAVRFLVDKTFTHINASMHEKYIALGKKNATLLKTVQTQFMYKGTIYPLDYTPPYRVRVPILHYFLIEELNTINESLIQADYHYVKNFFIAAISQSHNQIVLESLLPTVLISELKSYFTDREFKIIDSGVYGGLQQEPISITKQNIKEIQAHYKHTITLLQHLLMDKLLLES